MTTNVNCEAFSSVARSDCGSDAEIGATRDKNVTVLKFIAIYPDYQFRLLGLIVRPSFETSTGTGQYMYFRLFKALPSIIPMSQLY